MNLAYRLTAVLLLAGCGSSVGPQGTLDAGPDALATTDAARPDSGASEDVLSPPPLQDAQVIPGHCFPYEPSEVIAPRVLFTDQTLGLTATVRGMTLSCGAAPMLSGDPAQLTWSLGACGGCEACDCIDPGYQFGSESPAPAAGEHTLRVGARTQTLQVFPRDACFAAQFAPADGLRVEVVGPDASLRSTGPRVWWAHVTGNESRCCGEPTLAATVSAVRPANADLAVALFECVPDTCACAGSPHAFDTWVDLGELSPGDHGLIVSGSGAVVHFTVPATR